jgi:hypothetical protein
MTTNAATIRGPQPTNADIDKARADLIEWHLTDSTSAYPFLAGVTGTLLELISESHEHCRKPGCDICRHLRRAAAVRVAFREVRR